MLPNKYTSSLPETLYTPSVSLSAWYFKRIITYCLLHPYLSSPRSLFSPIYLSFSLPSHFLFLYLSHTETDTPPSPSLVIVMVCQSVHVSQLGGFSGWVTRPALLFSDTCQTLTCHLCTEMEMSRSDTTCQRWRWQLTSFCRLLNQLLGSQLVCWLGNNNYLLQAFRWTLFVMQWCHTTQTLDAADMAQESCTTRVHLHMSNSLILQMSLEFVLPRTSVLT